MLIIHGHVHQLDDLYLLLQFGVGLVLQTILCDFFNFGKVLVPLSGGQLLPIP
jgi:hypothetical protein